MTDTPTLPAGTRLGRTALRVADLDATVAFYRRTVGLAVLDRDDERATLGVDGTPLLVLTAAPDAPARGEDEAGLFHTAFRVPSRAALGDALARVREHATLTGASDHLVSEALYFRDPEGNGVEVYRDYPREEWPTREDGSVHIDTVPLDLDAVAAAATGDDTAPPGTDVGHVHLEVSALDAAARFYVDALGFATQTELPQARFVAADGYHHHVGLNTWNRRTEPSRGGGLDWFEVVVPDADALGAVRDRLVDRGTTVVETAAGFEAADPDGIRVRVRTE